MSDEIIKRLEDVETEVKVLKTAFPSGDVDGHRRYHDLMIEQVEERRKLRQAIQEKTISGLLWAGMLVMGLAVWQYVKTLIWRAGP